MVEAPKIPESFSREQFLQMIFTIALLFAIASIVHSDSVGESQVQGDTSGYQIAHVLYEDIYGWMRTLPCAQHRFESNLEVLEKHPELITAYESSLAHWFEYYSIDQTGILARAIDDALFREMFESGDLFLCLVDGFTVSEIKAEIGDKIQRTMEDASIGLLDQKAYRITTNIVQVLPPNWQAQLVLSEDGTHVTPGSLADFLNSGSIAERMDRAIGLAAATGSVVYPEISAIAREQGIDDWHLQQITSYVICCSGPRQANQEVGGEYGWQILDHWQAWGEAYMSNPKSYNAHDYRGILALGQ